MAGESHTAAISLARCAMQVRDVMTTRVLTIDAGDSIDRARAKMRQKGVHQLVVRKRGRVAGVIGAADVRAAPDDACVADYMPRKLVIVRQGTDLGAAAALMRANAIGSLPVLKGTRLVGIVTVSDMLNVVDDADGRRVPTASQRAAVPKGRRSTARR
jgi:acetoin utilization protein AcuB